MPVIEVRNLHKSYSDRIAVQDVSFAVEPGEIFGIIGPNGAGKTTTVECIEGLRVPDSGTVKVLGLDPRRDGAQLRQRLAREIHDTLAQGLTGIITQLEAAEQARELSAQWQQHANVALTLARESLSEARRAVQALQPEPLEGSRLADAIGDMATRWSESSSIPVHLETTGRPTPLLTDLEVTLYRVAQEALTNVGKHAKASRVGVRVSYMEDVVMLDVRDDGVGFLPASATSTVKSGSGFGLKAAEQRLRRVGGQLAIESALGGGTAISASVPTIPVEGSL